MQYSRNPLLIYLIYLSNLFNLSINLLDWQPWRWNLAPKSLIHEKLSLPDTIYSFLLLIVLYIYASARKKVTTGYSTERVLLNKLLGLNYWNHWSCNNNYIQLVYPKTVYSVEFVSWLVSQTQIITTAIVQFHRRNSTFCICWPKQIHKAHMHKRVFVVGLFKSSILSTNMHIICSSRSFLSY